MLDESEIVRILAELVSIESVNPDLVPGGTGEAAIARYVASFLKSVGFETRLREVVPHRFNAVGVLRGHGRGRSLMFNGHLDTVGVAEMRDPFSPRVENGRLYGRGAQDMKGGLAAALAAAATLASEGGLRGDLLVAAVADEEHRSLGARALLKEYKVDAAIVMEPTGLEVATAHKGFAWAEVETQGRAAHGSSPEEGQDAIVLMGHVLVEIEKLRDELTAGHRHPLLGYGSVHASLISGGQELSSYPERCRLSLERRLLPGEDARTVETELQNVLARCSEKGPHFQARRRVTYWAQPLETDQESAIAQTLLAGARKVIGPSSKFAAQNFWTDAALFSEAGIPTVLFGPGGAGLHAAVEYVRIKDLVPCATTLVECARAFCGTYRG